MSLFGIRPPLCFTHVAVDPQKQTLLVGFSHCRRFEIIEATIPKNRSRASGTPWGRVFGRLCASAI